MKEEGSKQCGMANNNVLHRIIKEDLRHRFDPARGSFVKIANMRVGLEWTKGFILFDI